ncbi:MAG: hypothetical protein EOP34_08740 [Rickettsiales bacterium]|nr:MAG: hypothetical protein EOP34_08740 [Rickettsiales bacterium]
MTLANIEEYIAMLSNSTNISLQSMENKLHISLLPNSKISISTISMLFPNETIEKSIIHHSDLNSFLKRKLENHTYRLIFITNILTDSEICLDV